MYYTSISIVTCHMHMEQQAKYFHSYMNVYILLHASILQSEPFIFKNKSVFIRNLLFFLSETVAA